MVFKSSFIDGFPNHISIRYKLLYPFQLLVFPSSPIPTGPHIASDPADPDTKGEGFDEATPDAQRHSASPTGVDATQRRRGIRHVRRELQNLVLWRGEFWEKLDHRKYEKLGIMM